MNDLINNNWFVSIVSSFIVVMILSVFKFLVNLRHHLSKKGLIGKFIRYCSAKELRKIKYIRKDVILVNREVIRCHTYQIIFWLSMMIYFWFILSLSILSDEFRKYIIQDHLTYNILAILAGLPLFIFEFLYLSKRNFVENLLKYRR